MKKNHNILFVILAAALLIGGSVWYYFYWQGHMYYTTDNAKVAAKTYVLTPPAGGGGEIVRLNCELGAFVNAGQTLARFRNGTAVKSPVDGFVIKTDVVPRQIVTAATVIAVVADIDRMHIGANVEETDIMKIREGQPVEVRLDAVPGKVFAGYVSLVDYVTQSLLSGAAGSFTTSGTYTKVTQLIPIEIMLYEDVPLEYMLGTNASVKIRIN